MSIIKSKAEKELEKKMLVKRSMNELERRVAKLKKQEDVYIAAGKTAMRENLPEQVKLAKDAYKLTVAEEKRTMKMLLNAQIIAQMKDMTQMTKEFLGAVQILSNEIAQNTNVNVSKMTAELNKAMQKAGMQTEMLGQLLELSQDNIESVGATEDVISDEEIDKVFYSESGAGDTVSDNAIDEEIKNLNKRFNG